MFKIYVERGSFIHSDDNDLKEYFRSWHLNPLEGGYQYDLGYLSKSAISTILDVVNNATEEAIVDNIIDEIKAGIRFIGISIEFENTAVAAEETYLIKLIKDLSEKAAYSFVSNDETIANLSVTNRPTWVDSLIIHNTFIIKVSDKEATQFSKMNEVEIIRYYSNSMTKGS